MKTVSIRWCKTGELRYDKVHRDYQCTCCGAWFQDDFVTVMDANDVPGVQDMSYCPVCGAEFKQREK